MKRIIGNDDIEQDILKFEAELDFAIQSFHISSQTQIHGEIRAMQKFMARGEHDVEQKLQDILDQVRHVRERSDSVMAPLLNSPTPGPNAKLFLPASNIIKHCNPEERLTHPPGN